MCTICGCGTGPEAPGDSLSAEAIAHAHNHDHMHAAHAHPHPLLRRDDFPGDPTGRRRAPFSPQRMIRIEQDILAKNNAFATANRNRLREAGMFAMNLVSSPGSGKTSLLVRAIDDLKGLMPILVIEGDQQTSRDADRIRAAGATAIQINTGKGCHLDAHMIGHALDQLPLAKDGLLFIENVGNLVCPAAFDLGEALKVVVLSVTEGEDKPLKYPDMFAASELMLLNKIDLLPHLEFDAKACFEAAKAVNPSIQILGVSARTGAGLRAFYAWVAARAAGMRPRLTSSS